MKENKKILGILIAAVILLVVMPVVAFLTNSKGENIVTTFNDAFNSEEKTIIYLGRPTCSYCAMYKPILDSLTKEYDIEYTYVNTDEITSAQLNTILSKLGLSPNSFGTPYTAIVENGKVIDDIAGYVDESSLFVELQKNGFIPEEAKLQINYIGFTEYSEMIKKEDKSIIVIGQSGCSACTSALPVLKEISEEYDIEINYLNVSDFSEEEGKQFESSLPFIKEESWGTPLMLVVSNNSVLDSSKGFIDKTTYVNFLKTNGFVN